MATLTEQEKNAPGGMSTIDGGVMTGDNPDLVTETVQPPQQPPQPENITPQPIEEETEPSPTVVSTDSMREQLKKAEEDLKTMKSEIDAGQVEQPQETQTETTTETQAPSETLTDTQRMQSEIDSYTKESNKLLEQRKNDFNRYLTRSDNLLRSQTRSIQKKMDIRRADAEKVAQNAKAATNVLGARTGRLRYAPEIQRGIITGQENDLIETLATIDALEAAAIAKAESAAFTRDYDTFLDEIDNIDTLRKDRENKLDELNEALETENKRREDELEMTMNETKIIEQISAGITDPIEVYNALNGQVPYDMVKAYTDTLPGGGVTEFEFIKGDKYNNAGYFDPTTGDFVNIGGGVSIGTDGSVSYDGPLTINGQAVGDVSPNITLDDIDNLNISETAKSFVRMYKEGRISKDEILQRLSGDKTDRALRNEVIGVISRMEAPVETDTEMDIYIQEQANTAVNNIEDILRLMNVTKQEDGSWSPGPMFGTEAKPLIRVIGQFFPGTDAKDIRTKLDTIEALIGFDALADMRAASPTGGALGQVTEKELKFLQSVRGSLDMGQSTDEFLGTLKEVYDSFQTLDEQVEKGVATAVPKPEAQSNQSLLLGDEEQDTDLVPSVLDNLGD